MIFNILNLCFISKFSEWLFLFRRQKSLSWLFLLFGVHYEDITSFFTRSISTCALSRTFFSSSTSFMSSRRRLLNWDFMRSRELRSCWTSSCRATCCSRGTEFWRSSRTSCRSFSSSAIATWWPSPAAPVVRKSVSIKRLCTMTAFC